MKTIKFNVGYVVVELSIGFDGATATMSYQGHVVNCKYSFHTQACMLDMEEIVYDAKLHQTAVDEIELRYLLK